MILIINLSTKFSTPHTSYQTTKKCLVILFKITRHFNENKASFFYFAELGFQR